MKTGAMAIMTVFALFLLAASASAQQSFSRELRVEGETFQLPEFGGLLSVENDTIRFLVVPPADHRPANYKDLDIEEGDAVLMADGKRLRSIEDFRSHYESLPVGKTFKLGLQRGKRLFLVSMPKIDPENAPVMRMKTMTLDSDSEQPMTIAGELAAIIHEKEAGLTVQKLPVPENDNHPGFLEDDILLSVNGKITKTVAEFDAAYGGLAVGDPVTFSVKRDGKTIKLEITKPASMKNMMIRKQ